MKFIEINLRLVGLPAGGGGGARYPDWLIAWALGRDPRGVQADRGWTDGPVMLRWDDAVFVRRDERSGESDSRLIFVLRCDPSDHGAHDVGALVGVDVSGPQQQHHVLAVAVGSREPHDVRGAAIAVDEAVGERGAGGGVPSRVIIFAPSTRRQRLGAVRRSRVAAAGFVEA